MRPRDPAPPRAGGGARQKIQGRKAPPPEFLIGAIGEVVLHRGGGLVLRCCESRNTATGWPQTAGPHGRTWTPQRHVIGEWAAKRCFSWARPTSHTTPHDVHLWGAKGRTRSNQIAKAEIGNLFKQGNYRTLNS